MSYKLYDHTYNNPLARTRNAIDGVHVNNAFSYWNNVHYEGDKNPIFSSAIFKENVEVLSKPWRLRRRRRRRRQRRAKTLIFSNIFVITEDIELKLRVVVRYQKGDPYY